MKYSVSLSQVVWSIFNAAAGLIPVNRENIVPPAFNRCFHVSQYGIYLSKQLITVGSDTLVQGMFSPLPNGFSLEVINRIELHVDKGIISICLDCGHKGSFVLWAFAPEASMAFTIPAGIIDLNKSTQLSAAISFRHELFCLTTILYFCSLYTTNFTRLSPTWPQRAVLQPWKALPAWWQTSVFDGVNKFFDDMSSWFAPLKSLCCQGFFVSIPPTQHCYNRPPIFQNPFPEKIQRAFLQTNHMLLLIIDR